MEDSTFSSQKDGPQQETVTVLHRYPFTSALKRMAVMLRVQQGGASGSDRVGGRQGRAGGYRAALGQSARLLCSRIQALCRRGRKVRRCCT